MRRIVPLLFILHFSFFIAPAHAQWEPANLPIRDTITYMIAMHDTVFMTVADGDVYISTDDGSRWQMFVFGDRNNTVMMVAGNELYYGLKAIDLQGTTLRNNYNGMLASKVYSFAQYNGEIFAGTDEGVYVSTNNGIYWNAIDNGLPSDIQVYSLLINDGELFAGTNEGIYESVQNGLIWIPLGKSLAGYKVTFLFENLGTIFAGTDNGTFTSSDNGASWSKPNNLLSDAAVNGMIARGDAIYAATNGGVLYSFDNGNSWSSLSTRAPYSSVYSVTIAGNYLLAGTGEGVFRTTLGSNTWQYANTGIAELSVNSFLTLGDTLYASTSEGLMRTTDQGNSWIYISGDPQKSFMNELVSFGNNLFAIMGDYYTISGVFRSTDGGLHWLSADSGMNGQYLSHLATNGSALFAATSGSYVYRSLDSGATWLNVTNGMVGNYFNGLWTIGETIYCGSENGLFRSTDNGDSWVAIDSGLPDGASINAFGNTENDLFVGTSVSGYSSETYNAYRSSDNGDHWVQADSGIGDAEVNDLFGVHGDVFASVWYGGNVYFTNDDGNSWNAKNEGLLPDNFYAYYYGSVIFGASRNNIFAGTNGTLYSRPLSDFGISAVNEKPNDLPAQFSLQQNYPNPFSGMTNVEFRIPKEESVTLNVYNMLGEKVATLAQGTMSAGTRSISFSGDGLQNGIYFYRLTAGKNVQTGKMTVIR